MTADLPTAALGSSQAPTAAVDKSPSASNTKIQTPPIESAKLNGHDPWAYLKDVLTRLPTLKDRDLHTLLPHTWRAPEQSADCPRFDTTSA